MGFSARRRSMHKSTRAGICGIHMSDTGLVSLGSSRIGLGRPVPSRIGLTRHSAFILCILVLALLGCEEYDTKTYDMCSFGMKFPCGRYQAATGAPDSFIKLELINKNAGPSDILRDLYVYSADISLTTGTGIEVSDYSLCFNSISDMHCAPPSGGGPNNATGEVDFRNSDEQNHILWKEDEKKALIISIDNPQDFNLGDRIFLNITFKAYSTHSSPAFSKTMKGRVILTVE